MAAVFSEAGRLSRLIASRTRSLASQGLDRLNRQLANDRFQQPEVAEYSVALVHAGGPPTTYQVRQWVRPVNELSRELSERGLPGAVILVRDARVVGQLAAIAQVPVVLASSMDQLIAALNVPTMRLALYANHNTLNFQAIAAQRPAHVHVGHGESDKASMVSNQIKAYDAALIAGQGALDRMRAHLVGLELVHLHQVGRPQMDFPDPEPYAIPATDRKTVLYAPTWEGDRPEMSYSSVASCGQRTVQDLMAAGWRIIYRPHPQTGRMSSLVRSADRAIRKTLRAEPAAGHVVDDQPALGWQWRYADAAILDVSAMAFDALAADVPTVVIEPSVARAERVAGGILETLTVMDAEYGNILVSFAEAEGMDATAQRRKLAEYYFGDVTPGAQKDRFLAACKEILNQRDHELVQLEVEKTLYEG